MENQAGGSIGDLFHRLVDDGRKLVGAEVDFYKQVAIHRAGKARSGIVAFVAGALLAYAGLIAALVGIVIGLQPLIGAVGGGLVVLAATSIIAFLLFRYGASKMGALSGDAEEQAAVKAGEL